MAQADLRRVKQAAARVTKAETELQAAIHAARASGETYRDIAAAAGVSHQTIWQLMRKQ